MLTAEQYDLLNALAKGGLDPAEERVLLNQHGTVVLDLIDAGYLQVFAPGSAIDREMGPCDVMDAGWAALDEYETNRPVNGGAL